MLSAMDADKLIKRFFLREDAGKGLFENRENLKILIPLTGVQSLVRVVEVDGLGVGIIRIYSREESKEADRRRSVHELVRRNSLPAPAFVDLETDPITGAILVLEEFVSGEHPSPETMDDTRISALAEAFCKLHRVESHTHVTIEGKKAGHFVSEVSNKVRNRFRALIRWFPNGLDVKERKKVQDWFVRFRDRLDAVSSFTLIHDKPNVGNLLWNGDVGQFFFIDLETMTYGHRAKDIVQVCHEVLGDDAGKVGTFLEGYFRDLSPEVVEEFGILEPFFHAYYHLSRCAANCRRLRKDKRGLISPFAANAGEHWKTLTALVDAEA